MIRQILALFGLRIEYVSEFGVHSHRYDSIDRHMGRPIHKNMSVAPPWAKLRIVKDAPPMTNTNHQAEVLAEELDRMWEQLDPIDGWRPALDAAGESLRRIPALEADLEAARAQRDKFMERDASACARAEDAEAERDQLRAEAEALRADAERYRWLRDAHNGDDGESFCVFAPVGANAGGLEPVGSLPGELDAAIDAARKQQ